MGAHKRERGWGGGNGGGGIGLPDSIDERQTVLMRGVGAGRLCIVSNRAIGSTLASRARAPALP